MKNLIRLSTFFGLAVCSNTLAAIAADSKVYQFDGWKVTITSGRSASAPARSSPNQPAVSAPGIAPGEASSSRSRIEVRPVSFQDNTPEASARKPEDGDAASINNSVPVFTEIPFPLPPSPPSDQPTIVRSDAASDCCDLPVITPRSPDLAPLQSLAIIPPQTALYRDIYFSIPFNRAEYRAYPSYRHDATMELLFNQMRNTVIQRGTTNVYQYDMGYNSPYNQYYPFNYGLRIHSSR